jgi:hypothetical protein
VKKYLAKKAPQAAPAQTKSAAETNPVMDAVKQTLGK